MDITPIIHAAIAVAVQCAFGVYLGDWITGAVIGCTWFIAREHTQAEYRWIEKFGGGLRSSLRAKDAFDMRVWDIGSLLDFAVPVIACTIVYVITMLAK